MPFHTRHADEEDGLSAQNSHAHSHTAASGLYRAAQALGSIGAPTGNLRAVTSDTTTSAGTDQLYYPDSLPHLTATTNAMNINGGHTAPPMSTGLPPPATSAGIPPPSSIANPTQPFETPRRGQQPFGRPPQEFHMPPSSGNAATNPPMLYQSQQEYGGNGGPSINLQQSTPQHQPSSNSANHVPGALQPGHASRPLAPSANTAPSSIPTLPQISTQQPVTPSRSALNHTHSYSRSSPAGLDDPKYKSFGNTPDASKYASPSNQGYGMSNAQSSSAYSPLGLADIRPRADTGFSDGPASPGFFPHNGDLQIPSNSNYLAPWAIYALDWCKWPSPASRDNSSFGRVAIGSYLEDSHNFIQILDAQKASPDDISDAYGNEIGLDFVKTAEATHSYPVTRILWEPPSTQKQTTNLLATSGDHLRLWSLPNDPQTSHGSNNITRSGGMKDPPQKITPLALLSNSKSPEHTAPITSLDWNVVSPSLIITSSIDTTCTIWDIPTLTAKTQLIAHDKEVYDVRFCANSVDVFVSCGADGSVRMFDLRSLEHSTIIYEPSDKTDKAASPGNMSPSSSKQTVSTPPPLLRIAASPHDAHLLGTFSQDSSLIRILDVRQPGQALLELRGHSAPVNCIEWSQSRRGTLASGADDSLVLIWDLLNQSNSAVVPGQTPGSERGPTAAWQCDYEVSNVSWSPQTDAAGNDWLSVVGGRGMWGVSM